MINPGPVAQGRALTRLGQEYRDRYRRIYLDMPNGTGRSGRRNSSLRQLSHEYPERYRQLYDEEARLRTQNIDPRSINPDLVGTASGPGPWHAILADGSTTACGRIRFRTRPAGPTRLMNCMSCADELRTKPIWTGSPEFGERVVAAEALFRQYADIQRQATVAQDALLEALSSLRTPPSGTAERNRLSVLLGEILAGGLTLKAIGARMGLSGERVRQIAAQREPEVSDAG